LLWEDRPIVPTAMCVFGLQHVGVSLLHRASASTPDADERTNGDSTQQLGRAAKWWPYTGAPRCDATSNLKI
jgi:hypothetical protein